VIIARLPTTAVPNSASPGDPTAKSVMPSPSISPILASENPNWSFFTINPSNPPSSSEINSKNFTVPSEGNAPAKFKVITEPKITRNRLAEDNLLKNCNKKSD